MNFSERIPVSIKRLFLWLGFIAAYAQTPLYTSNQNNYFIHGLTNAGWRFLSKDWTAGTVDPYPVFTALVRFLASHEWLSLTYLIYAVVLGLYIYGLMGVVAKTYQFKEFSLSYLAAYFFIVLTHSSWFSDFSMRKTGMDMRALLVDGVADMYSIGTMFQPSVFGVFFVTAVYFYLKHKPVLALTFASTAVYFHTISIMPFSILFISICVATLINKEKKRPILISGILAFIITFPIVWYIKTRFSPTTAELFKESQSILVHYRLPHHTVPSVWFIWTAKFKIALALVALVSVWRKPVFPVLLTGILMTAGLTIFRVISDNNTLALSMPWRATGWISPLCLCVLIGQMVVFAGTWIKTKPSPKIASRPLGWSLIGVLIFIGGYGVQKFNRDLAKREADDHAPVLNYVRDHSSADSVYLIDPLLADFRLQTGVPVFVDLKTHPHKDVEVLEWYKRMELSRSFFNAPDTNKACEALQHLRESYEITDIVFIKEKMAQCPDTKLVSEDGSYALFEVEPSTRPYKANTAKLS